MILLVFDDKASLAEEAARRAAKVIKQAIAENGLARIVAATGAAQIEFLETLTSSPDIEWSQVEMFHLDEYIGLSSSHKASFCGYLMERLILKTGITRYHLLDGEADPQQVIMHVGDEIRSSPIDVAFVGIGENGHLAFNDPPANFDTEEPYLIVDLDVPCRRQQVAEGWFNDISEVPPRAISMSIHQILSAKEILAIVPDSRKAEAVRKCFEGPIGPEAPASILRNHENARVYLDRKSAALLSDVEWSRWPT